MKTGQFSFDLVDKYTPDVVIKNEIMQLEEVTNGYVCGHIEKYTGPIKSYKKIDINTALQSFKNETSDLDIDIQNDLGPIGQTINKYEVFITVKGLEYFKYRLMFVEFGTVSYPVTIVLNEDLAIAYSGKRSYIYSIDSMNEMQDMMEKIMDSSTMVKLIQSLINEAIRQENAEASAK